jgi:hypothetical protein
MAKKIYTGIASCITVIITLAIVAPPSAAAFDERPQEEHRHAADRRHRTPRKKARRRQAVSYVCPMHPDMRSKSPGTCPKCLMELVRRNAKPERRS